MHVAACHYIARFEDMGARGNNEFTDESLPSWKCCSKNRRRFSEAKFESPIASPRSKLSSSQEWNQIQRVTNSE